MSSEILLWSSVLLLLATSMALASGQEFDGKVMEQKLNLDIYLYETGKTLVAGYVDNPMSLSFLRPPLYITEYATQNAPNFGYENDTHQLYAWTDALTTKREETWNLIFSSHGFYNECHIVFHLPQRDLRLGRINCSDDLNYLISASNDYLIVDVQGYRVRDPAISVEYQQPIMIENNDGNENNSGAGSNADFSQTFLLWILALIIVGGVLAFHLARRKEASFTTEPLVPESETGKLDLSEDSSEDAAGFDEMPPAASQPEGTEDRCEPRDDGGYGCPDHQGASHH